jgi:hypothetical protein
MPRSRLDQRSIVVVVLFLLIGNGLARAQSESLALSSASATGGSVSMNLTLTSVIGSEPGSLQWSLVYSTSDIVSINVSAGTALTSQGKTLNCGGAAGTLNCVAAAINTNAIQNGVVAVVSGESRS